MKKPKLEVITVRVPTAVRRSIQSAAKMTDQSMNKFVMAAAYKMALDIHAEKEREDELARPG